MLPVTPTDLRMVEFLCSWEGKVSYSWYAYTYPANMFRRVLFPAPLGPKIAVRFPDKNFPLMDFRICLRTEKKSLKVNSCRKLPPANANAI